MSPASAERTTWLPSEAVVGVVGAGVMGRGIAQIAAQAGLVVRLYDVNGAAVTHAITDIGQQLNKLVAKGKLEAAAAARATALITAAPALADLAPCHLVVEAVIEDLAVKRELFKSLEALVSEQCILATNTSSLSIAAIQAPLKRPERCAGLHFFNPVPLMKVVEVIDGPLTGPGVADALLGLVERLGHRGVKALDSPGFLVNHAGRGYGTEALRILGEGIAPVETIDAALRSVGFKMGPFELLDLIGLDVSHRVMESIYHQYYEEPRYRPSPIARQRVEAGLLGRKSGRGFYDYRDGAASAKPKEAAPPAKGAAKTGGGRAFWIGPAPQLLREARARIQTLLDKLGARIDRGERPAADSICLVLPLGDDATTAAVAAGVDPTRTLAMDAMFDVEKYRVLTATPATSADVRAAALATFTGDGVEAHVVRDSAGGIAARVVAMIVNIACDIAQQRIATPDAIDVAVKLGLGYPDGPLRMGDTLGAAIVLAILERLHAFYGDPRYRASPWLKRRVALGIPLITPEA